MDDLVFGSGGKFLVDEFVKNMTEQFKRSMFGSLNYFLGHQVT